MTKRKDKRPYKWRITEEWATGPALKIEGEGESFEDALAKIAALRPKEGFLRVQQRDKVFQGEES